MTIGGIVVGAMLTVAAIIYAVIAIRCYNFNGVVVGIVSLLVIAALWGGLFWYYNNTASGTRAVTDQRSELNNGLNREITVYTADGEIIAHYVGKIDLEDNEGGYVIFDYDGKRYTYYNCFVESIAVID